MHSLINDNNMEGAVPDWSRTSQKLYDLEMLFLTENMWSCPPANYSNWTRYTDMSDREEPCACLLSSWSEWSECHESFGPGSVTVQTRTRTILQEAQNGGRCPDLREYRDCKIHAARILFNGSIPVKELCIGAGITDVVTEVDLFEWYTGDIEIENIVLNYTNGAINCNRDQEWSWSYFGCVLCKPWKWVAFDQYTFNNRSCGVITKIVQLTVDSAQKCAELCHATQGCVAFLYNKLNNNCETKESSNTYQNGCGSTYDFDNKLLYTIEADNALNVKYMDDSIIDINGKLQIYFNEEVFRAHNSTLFNEYGVEQLSQWGTILSHGFDDNAGIVACRMFGDRDLVEVVELDDDLLNDIDYEHLIEVKDQNINDYIWIEYIQCDGTELSLWDCNITLPTNLTKFRISENITGVVVQCTDKHDYCHPLSIFLTEETDETTSPVVVAPLFESSMFHLYLYIFIC